MNEANEPTAAPAQVSSLLATLVDELTNRVQAGEALDWDAVARKYPEYAEKLRRLLPAMGALEALSRSAHKGKPLGVGGPDLAGQMVGDFRIVRELGRGGMGVVYEAVQISLEKRVALKIILAGAFASPDDVARFRLEAEAVAGLDHPNIVPVYAIGEYQGWHYFSMKWVEGGSLDGQLSRF